MDCQTTVVLGNKAKAQKGPKGLFILIVIEPIEVRLFRHQGGCRPTLYLNWLKVRMIDIVRTTFDRASVCYYTTRICIFCCPAKITVDCSGISVDISVERVIRWRHMVVATA